MVLTGPWARYGHRCSEEWWGAARTLAERGVGTKALARATAGIAMGGIGSDAAMEGGDVVRMGDDLGALPYALRPCRHARAGASSGSGRAQGVTIASARDIPARRAAPGARALDRRPRPGHIQPLEGESPRSPSGG